MFTPRPLVPALIAAGLVLSGIAAHVAFAADGQNPAADASYSSAFVPTHVDRIILLDIAKAGVRLVAVGERGVVFSSDDQGKTWGAQRTASTNTLTMLAFSDAQNGVAVGHGSVVLRTTDGGKSWAKIDVPDAGGDSLLGVTWLGAQRFVAYGGFGLYIESTDGGKTWKRHRILDADFDRHISRVLAVGEGKYLLVGESGTLALSDDALNWTAQKSPYEGSWFGALRTQSGAVLLYGMRGHLYRSEDQAKTWSPVDIKDERSIMNALQLADGRIVLVGMGGQIQISSDDGRSFTRLAQKTQESFAQVLSLPDGNLLTAGDAGVRPLVLSTHK